MQGRNCIVEIAEIVTGLVEAKLSASFWRLKPDDEMLPMTE